MPFERGGRRYTLVDTAGLRRRGKQGESLERFSIVKTLQAIEESNVAVFMLDAADGVTEQDAHVAGYILERGRAVVVAVNKWDAADKEARERIKSELAWKLGFLGFADTHFISAKSAKGLGALMKSVDAAYAAAMARLPTPKLTRALIAAVERQAPPRSGAIRPKLRYAHQGGINPPRIIVHGNRLERMPDSYRRYLEGFFASSSALPARRWRSSFAAAGAIPSHAAERRTAIRLRARRRGLRARPVRRRARRETARRMPRRGPPRRGSAAGGMRVPGRPARCARRSAATGILRRVWR